MPGAITKFIERTRRDRIYDGIFQKEFNFYYDVYQPPDQAPAMPRRESGYLIPLGRDDLIISFATNLRTSEMLGCQMKFERGDLALRVSFSSKHLYQYVQIKERVTDFVGPFIVK